MTEIELKKRMVYAGDVHIALLKSGWSIREACDFVNGLPKADVAPARYGRWITTAYTTISKRNRVISNVKYTCSECGYGNGRKRSNYCPNCGADMRGTDNGE